MTKSIPTFLTAFTIQVDRQPDASALTWLHNGETPTATLTYRQLAQQAQAIAAQLLARGLRPGERVLLVYAEGLAFLPAFLGCLYAGMVAVPAPPPDALRGKRTLPHLQAVAADAQATMALTTRELQAHLPFAPTLPALSTDDLPTTLDTVESWPVIDAQQLAYLQYTSGSTGTPKGVMITHANLLANLAAIHQAIGYTANSAALTWLPHTHDFGLVEGLLRPLSAGVPCFIMSPWVFLRRPLRWLKAISLLRITHSAGSSFAYQHCLDVVDPEQCAGLDLACWQVAAIGAEPIRPALIENFATTFAPYGFQRNAFCPGYGMAETALVATAKARDMPVITRSFLMEGQPTLLTGCGHAWSDSQVLVVDPVTCQPLPEGEIGEVWVSGQSVAQGYWQRSPETVATFGVRLHGESYLRTGDLGLFDQGELFICGRLKDLIIIHGQNYHPQDIEWAIEDAHPLLKSGSKAVFSIDPPTAEQGAERLVIVCEIDPHAAKTTDLAILSEAVRDTVAASFALPVHAVTLIRRGTLPKTPSGKVQRRACRMAWLAGEIESLFTWQLTKAAPATGQTDAKADPRTPLEQALTNLWRELLNVEQIGLHDNFFQLGGHSLLVMRLMIEIEQQFQQSLVLRQFIFKPTISHLATLLCDPQATPSSDAQLATQGMPDLTADDEKLLILYDALEDGDKINQLRDEVRPEIVRPIHLKMLLHLPQSLTMQILCRALQQPWVQQRYLPKQTALVQQFLAGVEGPTNQKHLVAKSLFFSFLIHFGIRDAIFQNITPQGTRPIEGLEMLKNAHAQQQGVILLTSHCYQGRYLRSYQLTQSVIGNMELLTQNARFDRTRAEQILYARQLELAHQTLQGGKAIAIAPDVNRGYGPQISVPFHGRMHAFRTSFAELALLTNAQIFFVASDLKCYDQFSFRLVGPFDMGNEAMTHEKRVQHLMAQYVAYLRMQWAKNPWALPWWLMREHLAYPPVAMKVYGGMDFAQV